MKKKMSNILKKGVMLIIVLMLMLSPTITYAATNNSTSILEAVTQRYKNIKEYKAFLNSTNDYLSKMDTTISVDQAKIAIIDFLTQMQKNDYSDSTVISTLANQLLNTTVASTAATTPELLIAVGGSITDALANTSNALKSLTPSVDDIRIDATTAGQEAGSKYNVKLAGKIYYAGESDKPTNKWVLLLHGVLMNSQAMADAVGQMYLDQGYNILAIDSRGHGDSEGSVAMGYLESLDAWDWLNYLHEEYPNNCEKIIIHGVSLGGATTVFLSGMDLASQDVIGIVEDCGYTSLTGIITGMLGGTSDSDDTVTEEEATLIEKILSLPSEALSSIVGSSAAESLIETLLINLVDVGLTSENFDEHQDALVGLSENCNVPILIIHGTKDTTVPYANSNSIYNAAMANNKIKYVQRFIAEGEPHAFVMVGNKENIYKAHVETFIENVEAIDNGTYKSTSKEFIVDEPEEEGTSLIGSLLKALKLIKNMLF